MGKRGSVSDYAGEELFADDLVVYSARVGNRVRMTDAVVLEVTAKSIGGRLVPMIKVQPTGTDSGWGLGTRKTLVPQWVTTEHVRLVTPGFASAQGV